MKGKYRLAWEIVVFVAIQPVRSWLRGIAAAFVWLIRSVFSLHLIREVPWRIRRLWRLTPRGCDRYYSCTVCGRLCHLDATPGRYGPERVDGRIVTAGTCRRCMDKEEAEKSPNPP